MGSLSIKMKIIGNVSDKIIEIKNRKYVLIFKYIIFKLF